MEAVIYARYSSYNQTEQSIEGQLRACYDYARREGYKVIKEYIDRARTGTNDTRPAFQQMLEDAKEKTFQCVIVYQLDRFARNRRDSINNKFYLKKHGIRVLSATEPLTDTPENIIIEGFFEDIAEYYSLDLSKKARRGIRESVIKRQFIGGHVPYGYKVENKKILVNEEEAQVVREYFKQRAEGKAVKTIIRELVLKGAPLHYGRSISYSGFYHAEKNRKYIGEWDFHGEIITDLYPAIVDRETFEKVQKIVVRSKHSNKSKVDFILTGKLFCGECGSPMVGVGGTSKTGKVHHYYMCNKRLHKKTCNKSTEKKDFIEWYVCEQTIKYLLSSDRLDFIVDALYNETKTNPSVIQVQKIQSEIDRLNLELDQIANEWIGAPENIKSRLREKCDMIGKHIDDLESALFKAKTKVNMKVTKSDLRSWLTQYQHLDLENEKVRIKILTNFVNCVFLYDDQIVIYFNIQGSKLVSYIEMLDDLEQLDDSKGVRMEQANGGERGI